MEYDVVFPEDEVPPTDTSPVKLTPETDPSPDALLARAELKATELSHIRRTIAAAGRQQRQKTNIQARKNKNRRRRAIAAQSRKRNR
jgi:hypothetical protein